MLIRCFGWFEKSSKNCLQYFTLINYKLHKDHKNRRNLGIIIEHG